MTKKTRPNLFQHATKELSQDAMLAWLLQWADKALEQENIPLHQTGRYFIEKLFEKGKKTIPNFNAIEVKTQEAKIDILAYLDAPDGEKHAILIEDKVHAGEHSNQLNRYRNYLIDDKKYKPDNILPIFLKTGFQHEWSTAENAQYHVFTAEDLADVIDFGAKQGLKNDIFLDFAAHVGRLKSEFSEAKSAVGDFYNLPVSQWQYWHWKGYFEHLKALNPPVLSPVFTGDGQSRREHFLYFAFGQKRISFEYEGNDITIEPNFDINRTAYHTKLKLRLWIKDIVQSKIPIEPIRQKLLEHLAKIDFGEPCLMARRKAKAKESISLLNFDTFDIQKFKDSTELTKFLKVLQAKLHELPQTMTF